jgi:15-cis-phytoene synthase
MREELISSATTPRRKSAPSSIASPQDYAVCRRIMQRSSKNYSHASFYLPADRLKHVEALYALMRVGDDRVDVSHHGFQDHRAAIDHWEHAYWEAFHRGNSPEPVMRAYLDTALKFEIPADTMAAYYRAMRDDLTVTRFPTFADLLYYMDGSAIPVGRAMTYILGVLPSIQIQEALPGADSLSIAMQLSNFWRDIGEDWQKGRVYLPLEDLEHYDYSLDDLAANKVTPAFKALLEFEFERTERYYQTARRSVKMLASGRVAVTTALEIYRSIHANIRANRYDVFSQRASPSILQKIGLTLKAWWQASNPPH